RPRTRDFRKNLRKWLETANFVGQRWKPGERLKRQRFWNKRDRETALLQLREQGTSPTQEAVTTNDSVGSRVNAIPLINSRICHFGNVRAGNRQTGTPRRSRMESIHVVEDRHEEKLQVHRKHAQEERHTHEDCNRQVTSLRRVTDCGDETDKQRTPQNRDSP